MGLKGKFLKRFKRSRPRPSDASVDNSTIATVPPTPVNNKTNPKAADADPSPIRLPILGLDPEGITADDVQNIPSTPKHAKTSNNNARVSPDHTNSTKACSVDEENAVPDMKDEKNAFSDITDRAFGLVKKSSDLSDASKKAGKSIEESLVQESTEIQRVSSVVEFTSAPVDIDEDISSTVGSVQSKQSSGTQGSQKNKTRVSSFGRVFGRDIDRAVDKEEVVEEEVEIEEVKVTSSYINIEPEISEEDEPIRNSTSWVKDIEKHLVKKTPSNEEASKKSRQVSFDNETHHIKDDHYSSWRPYNGEEDSESSFDSSDFDDDSQYYDEECDDSIDEATYMTGDSTMLAENDEGIWSLLCGCDNYNLSPCSIEDQNDDDKSAESPTSRDDNDSADTGTPAKDEVPYTQVKPVRTLSYTKMGKKLRVVSPGPKLPSLLKKKETEPLKEKKETKLEPVAAELSHEKDDKKDFRDAKLNADEPRDSQGFPVKVNLLPKRPASSKKEQDPPADDAITTPKHKSYLSVKDSKQLEIYCKKKGGAENLVLRKYPSIPSPAGKDHVLVKVEASTVSSRDCLLRLQGDLDQPPKPQVPGFQIVGTIHSLGDGLKSNGDLQVGDRVAALTQGGGNARFISIPASSAILLPPTATNENTVCLVSNYMAAYQALKMAKMKKGGAPLTNSNVLVTGGSGPIGQALIDLATREGAIVYTTAHQMHQEHLTKNLKVEWFPVNPSKWLPKLEGQIDVVVDSLCVDGYESSYRALAPDGVLICTGNISAEMEKNPSNKLSLWWADVKAKHMWKNCYFYNIYDSYASDPKLFQQELLYLYLQMENGGIKPKVAGRVSLNQVPKAQRLIEKGLPNGTVILNPWKKLDPKQNVPIERCHNRDKSVKQGW